jgi:O-antigen ligase
VSSRYPIPNGTVRIEGRRGFFTARGDTSPVLSARLSSHTPAALCWLAVVPLLMSAFVDLGRSVSIGGVSGMGALTLLQVLLLGAGLSVCPGYPRRLVVSALPYLAFLTWACASTVWGSASINAGQNAAVYALFGAAIVLSGTLCARDSSGMVRTIDRGVRWVDYLSLTTVLGHLLLVGLPGADGDWLIGPRSFALVGLIPLSWHLAGFYEGQRGSWARASMWLIAIVLSLSRTVTAIGVLYVATVLALQLWFTPRSLTMSASRYVLVLSFVGVMGILTTPLQERFLSGDTSIELGDLRINASGRLNMWPVVIDSAREHPLIGKGLGSSQQVINAIVPTAGHPHNDYLRIWHDLGLVGLFLFAVSLLIWLWMLSVGWYRAVGINSRAARVKLAALLGLAGLLAAMTTDNAVIYPFVMGSLGVVVGAGLGHSHSTVRAGRLADGRPSADRWSWGKGHDPSGLTDQLRASVSCPAARSPSGPSGYSPRSCLHTNGAEPSLAGAVGRP